MSTQDRHSQIGYASTSSAAELARNLIGFLPQLGFCLQAVVGGVASPLTVEVVTAPGVVAWERATPMMGAMVWAVEAQARVYIPELMPLATPAVADQLVML